MAINRSLAIITSETYPGLINAHSFTDPKRQPISFAAGSGKILEVSFYNPDSNQIAVLTEDQNISVWKITDKPIQIGPLIHAEGNGFAHIRWNPYNNEEIFVFSDKQIYIFRNGVSGFRLMLNMPGSQTISDIFFISKSQECNSQCNFRFFNINKRNQ